MSTPGPSHQAIKRGSLLTAARGWGYIAKAERQQPPSYKRDETLHTYKVRYSGESPAFSPLILI